MSSIRRKSKIITFNQIYYVTWFSQGLISNIVFVFLLFSILRRNNSHGQHRFLLSQRYIPRSNCMYDQETGCMVFLFISLLFCPEDGMPITVSVKAYFQREILLAYKQPFTWRLPPPTSLQPPTQPPLLLRMYLTSPLGCNLLHAPGSWVSRLSSITLEKRYYINPS